MNVIFGERILVLPQAWTKYGSNDRYVGISFQVILRCPLGIE